MVLATGVWLAVLGILGASNLIIARKPDAKELIAKLAPYQGWMGALSAVWGVWMIIHAILNLGVLTAAPILWITYMASAVIQAGLGLLLGTGTLKTFVKQEQAHEKIDQLVTKLAPYQGTLGLISIGLGVWTVVASLLFSV